jgi:hypothetical protein
MTKKAALEPLQGDQGASRQTRRRGHLNDLDGQGEDHRGQQPGEGGHHPGDGAAHPGQAP